MKRMAKFACTLGFFSALASPVVVHAYYNANIQGVITSVRVYDSGSVLLTLNDQPTSHPVCNPSYFAIDSALAPDIRAALLSRALIAKSSGETVEIGYDNTGNCANGYIRLHEIGL